MNKLGSLLARLRNWLTANEVNVIDTTSVGYTHYYLGCCIVFYAVFMLVCCSKLLLSGNMLAEMGSNYYLNAESASWLHKLFATDSGYLPFLQRLIALIPNLVQMPALSVPYFYNGSALVISALLAGSFCAPQFRALLASDVLRFVVALLMLLFAGDEVSRQFLNFTYGVGFFITIILALAAVKRQQEVPWWSWFIPLLLVNKPVLLIFMPLMCLVSLISNSVRWRLITYCSVVLALIQFALIYYQHRLGICWHENLMVFSIRPDNSTILQKLWWSLSLLCRMVSMTLLGLQSGSGDHKLLIVRYANSEVLSWVVLGGMLLMILVRRNNASLLSGLCLMVAFGVCLFNNFTLSQCAQVNFHNWTPVPNNMSIIYISKYYKPAWDAVLLSILAIGAAWTPRSWRHENYYHALLVFVLLLWLYISNWGHIILHPPAPGYFNVWRAMSGLIDQRERPVCVHLTEVGWVYGRNCHSLSQEVPYHAIIMLRTPVLFKIMQEVNEHGTENSFSKEQLVEVPQSVRSSAHHLQSLMVYFVLNDVYLHVINLEAKVYLRDGKVVSLFGTSADMINLKGGAIFINADAMIPIAEIERVVLNFSVPVKILLIPKLLHDNQVNHEVNVSMIPSIEWFGN